MKSKPRSPSPSPPEPALDEPIEEDWETEAGLDAIVARRKKLREARGWLTDYEKDDLESLLQIRAFKRAGDKYQAKLRAVVARGGHRGGAVMKR